ncbi:MAG: alpha/beta hydrolase [Vicinamibacteraceae bacterium]
MSTLTTRDGVDLYFKDWGAGRPVILLHGWPLSSDTFDDLGMALADAGFRAIAYDRRGFGRSGQPWGGYDYDTLATDLADVIEKTGARGAALVGFSMGGGEVVRYLSTFRDHTVTRAILIGSVVPYMLQTSDNPKGTPQAVFDQMGQGITEDRATFWASFFPQFYGTSLLKRTVSQEVIDWSANVAMQASLKATLDCAKSFSTTDFRPDLKAVTVPTLIIHGTADATVPIDASSREAAKGIAGSVLKEYDGGPHGLLASHKDQVRDDVLAFLRAGG